MKTDTSFLEAALLGYQSRRAEILTAMADIERQLGGQASAPITEKAGRRKRQPLSAAARRRMAVAQRKRWAAYHEKQKAAN
jgi:hypothetical protein